MNTLSAAIKLAVAAAITASVLGLAGAATETGEMFRIEFTVYDNHTFAYLEADTVNGSKYLPFPENDALERYEFEFVDADGTVLHTEPVFVYFADHDRFSRSNITVDDDPRMTTTFTQIPVVPDAERLRIRHDGNERASLDLVDTICESASGSTCRPYCESHGIDTGCDAERSGNTLLLVLVLLVALGVAGGAILYYRKRSEERSQNTAGRIEL